jgi:hypothetical protein
MSKLTGKAIELQSRWAPSSQYKAIQFQRYSENDTYILYIAPVERLTEPGCIATCTRHKWSTHFMTRAIFATINSNNSKHLTPDLRSWIPLPRFLIHFIHFFTSKLGHILAFISRAKPHQLQSTPLVHSKYPQWQSPSSNSVLNPCTHKYSLKYSPKRPFIPYITQLRHSRRSLRIFAIPIFRSASPTAVIPLFCNLCLTVSAEASEHLHVWHWYIVQHLAGFEILLDFKSSGPLLSSMELHLRKVRGGSCYSVLCLFQVYHVSWSF